MIKIEKDINEIPVSLVPAYLDLFPEQGAIPRVSNTTHLKRMHIINNEAYIDESEFNNRYKNEDIRIALTTIYKNKCAYCEQKVEQYAIEHYRPKKTYYWLAFSWDNLLMACATCNQYKGVSFELEGEPATFVQTENNIREINSLSSEYNELELPKMINPEITDPLGEISFSQNGVIKSDNANFRYTINKCSIDRKYLNDERRKLLDIFERDLTSALVDNINLVDQENEISIIIKKFIRDSKDSDLQFLAFRRFAISSGWLNEITKSLN